MNKAIENIIEFTNENEVKLLKYQYIRSYRYKLTLLCECGSEFVRSYPNSKMNLKCDACVKVIQKNIRLEKSFNKFKTYVRENSKSTITSVEFRGMGAKHLFKCECGNIFETTPNDFKSQNKRTCRPCSSKRMAEKARHSIEHVRKYIKDNTNSELISDFYKNNKTELTMMCHCGNKYTSSFHLLRSGHNIECEECIIEKRASHHRLDYEYVKNWIESNLKSKLLSKDYTNNHTKLSLLCECGKEYLATFMDIRVGKNKTCRECMIQNRAEECAHPYEYVDKYISENTTLKLISKTYTNFSSPLELICSCGRAFRRSFAIIRKDHLTLCPFCLGSSSKSERTTQDILEKYKVKYVQEKTFDGCVYKNKLRFDFYIPNVNTCIELDGEGHYEAILKFGGEDALASTQVKDNIKTRYCQENNISLIRIKYTDFDKIEEILKNKNIV